MRFQVSLAELFAFTALVAAGCWVCLYSGPWMPYAAFAMVAVFWVISLRFKK